MAKKPKATYPIVVDVSQSGAFTYSVEGNPQADATFLMVQPDESVSWLVRHGRRRIPVPFQIEFGVFNPMNMNETVIRSRGERTKPVLVNLDADYIGNLAFKCHDFHAEWLVGRSGHRSRAVGRRQEGRSQGRDDADRHVEPGHGRRREEDCRL